MKRQRVNGPPPDRCVGFEPHPMAIYADEFCVAPVYDAKPGEVARPHYCGRPRSEHSPAQLTNERRK